MEEVDLKIKAKEEPKNHKISKVRLQLEKVSEEKEENEEDVKEAMISDIELFTTHKMECYFWLKKQSSSKNVPETFFLQAKSFKFLRIIRLKILYHLS